MVIEAMGGSPRRRNARAERVIVAVRATHLPSRKTKPRLTAPGFAVTQRRALLGGGGGFLVGLRLAAPCRPWPWPWLPCRPSPCRPWLPCRPWPSPPSRPCRLPRGLRSLSALPCALASLSALAFAALSSLVIALASVRCVAVAAGCRSWPAVASVAPLVVFGFDALAALSALAAFASPLRASRPSALPARPRRPVPPASPGRRRCRRRCRRRLAHRRRGALALRDLRRRLGRTARCMSAPLTEMSPLILPKTPSLMPVDLHDVFRRLERTIGLAIVDDGLRLDRSDAGKRFELFLGRRVDVDRRQRDARPEQRDQREDDPFHLVLPTCRMGGMPHQRRKCSRHRPLNGSA